MSEIAALARVSKPTVSRALRNSPLVQPETKARVIAIARKHGYVVNRNAQRLREGRANTIAVVANVPSLLRGRVVDPFGFELLASVARALSLRQLDLLLCAAQVDELRAYQELLTSGDVDGIIFLAQGRREASLQALASKGVPMVVWGAPSATAAYSTVGGDDRRGGELAAERFARLGRTKALFIGGGDEHPQMKMRLEGFTAGLRVSRPAAEIRAIRPGSFSAEAARSALQKYLDSGGAIPDAIFAASDTMAMGVYEELEARGLHIPADVSVIGYNDNSHAAWCRPALTTIRHDTQQAGVLLVEQLMQALEGRRARSILMPAELIVRDS